jgi:hypothetical protein
MEPTDGNETQPFIMLIFLATVLFKITMEPLGSARGVFDLNSHEQCVQ